MSDSFFYSPDGDAFAASVWTRGPWSPDHQHAGPPAALLGRAIERALGQEFQVARVAFDIPRPIPIARLSVSVEEAGSGKRVRRLTASLSANGAEVMTARALAIRIGALDLPDLPPLDVEQPAPPDGVDEYPFPFFPDDEGYHRAMDVRFARGSFGQGRATAWMRAKIPLVSERPWTPLQRVLVAADSGNGVSNILDSKRFLFVNADLSVHLHRMPEGEWVCLDAYTAPEPEGIGLAHSRLFDQRGPIGHAAQSLLIAERNR
jgi:hypothetical protein